MNDPIISANSTHHSPLFGKLGIALFLLLQLILYGPIIYEQPLLKFDDQGVVVPLKDLHAWQDYRAALKEGKILDRAPIRDLSLWIDWQIAKIFHARPFHATNLVLWLGILLLFYRLRNKFSSPFLGAWGIALALYAFNPIMVDSVAWASARKHLLSAFFTLAATTYLIDRGPPFSWRNILAITLLYALAVLSGQLIFCGLCGPYCISWWNTLWWNSIAKNSLSSGPFS
jgi:protein O-mannosyl-transferase